MKDFNKELNELRKKALGLIGSGIVSSTNFSMDIESLLEELNIYQIELSLQNEELHQSNQKLMDEKIKNQELFEYAPFPYFILKSNGLVLRLNNAAKEFLSISSLNINFPIFRYLTEDSKLILHNKVKFIEDNDEANFNLRFISKDGSNRFTIAKLNSFWEEEHEDFLIRMTLIDQTENEINSNKLKEKERRLDSVFNNNLTGIMIFDKFGRLSDINKKMINCLGVLDKDQLLGMSIYDIPDVHLDTLSNLKDQDQIKIKSTFNFNDLKFKKSLPTTKNSIEYLEITIKKDKLGEYNLYFENITEKIKLDSQIRINEQRYKELFDNIMDGFALHEILTDDNNIPIDYIFLDVNKKFETITGLRRDRILNKRILQVLPQTENIWIETYGKVALTGIPITFTNFSIEFNKYFEVRAYSPSHKKFAVVFQDKTEEILLRKKAQELDLSIKQILEQAPLTILEVDDSSKYIWVNEHAQKTLGYSFEEFKKLKVENIVNIDSIETLEKFNNYLNEGIDKDIYELKSKSGEIKTFIIEAIIINERKFAFCIEITDMIKHKVKFDKLEQDYLNIMKNIDVTIIMIDKSYRIVEITGAFFEKNIQEKELFINKKIFDIIPEAEFDMNLYNLNQALLGEQSSFTIERPLLDESRFFEIRYNPYYVGNEIEGVIAISIDTTENVKLMNQMIESENRLNQIFENNEDIFWIMENSNITYISPNYKRTFDTKNFEIINGIFENYVILEDKVKFTKFVSKIKQNNVPPEHIEFRVNLDGRIIWLMIQAFKVFHAASEGMITGFIRNINNEKKYLLEKESFINDLKILQAINENKNKELQKIYNELSEKAENLRKSNEIKDSLFSIIAHDLRNPIFGIKSLFFELSEIIKTDDIDIAEMVNALNVSMEGLTELLEKLIFWSKLESKKLSFDSSIIDLRKTSEESIKSQKIMADAKRIKIINNIENGLEVVGDRKLLPFIFNNLISYAIKYSYNNSEIVIKSEMFDNYARISVQDYGIGMNSELINKLLSNTSMQSL